MNSKVSDRVYAVAASVFLGMAALSATVGIGTANAGCVEATGGAQVDCDGMLHSDLSGGTQQYADGQNGWVDGQGVENGGTQGTSCGAPSVSLQTVPRCN